MSDKKEEKPEVYKCTICGFETTDCRKWDVHIWICG